MFEQDVLSDRSESAHLVTEPTWWGARPREIRGQAELARLLADPVWRGVDLTSGDGEPMLLIPGFLAGDQYARNVEVTGSHIGLAFNRHAYREIAHILAPSA